MIEFKNVTKAFGRDTAAVADLNLVIPARQTTVIVGPSGCGKTTTLRLVNRMLEPTSGQIFWDGEPLSAMKKTDLRRRMGYVIQAGGLFPHRTVADNIATVPRLLRWDRRKTSRRVSELMELTELSPDLARRFPAELSGGQQQRVGVARALAADPEVLLMDEPFSAVDPVVRSGLQDMVRGLQRGLTKTIIMITHDLDEAIKMGDQVAIMKDGAIVQVDRPALILEEPATDFVRSFIGRDRGYRGLSFAASLDLPLSAVDTTRTPQTATTESPVLVLDRRGRPTGWVDPLHAGAQLEIGGVFDPSTDSLRSALDAALSSPMGRAIAVTGESRRYAGVVTIPALMEAVALYREDLAKARAERDVPEPGSDDVERGVPGVRVAEADAAEKKKAATRGAKARRLASSSAAGGVSNSEASDDLKPEAADAPEAAQDTTEPPRDGTAEGPEQDAPAAAESNGRADDDQDPPQVLDDVDQSRSTDQPGHVADTPDLGVGTEKP